MEETFEANACCGACCAPGALEAPLMSSDATSNKKSLPSWPPPPPPALPPLPLRRRKLSRRVVVVLSLSKLSRRDGASRGTSAAAIIPMAVGVGVCDPSDGGPDDGPIAGLFPFFAPLPAAAATALVLPEMKSSRSSSGGGGGGSGLGWPPGRGSRTLRSLTPL